MSGNISPEAVAQMLQRLRAPHYWMSGSDQGHEGENDAPRDCADMLETLAARVVELEASHAAALESVKAQAREEAAKIADAYAQDSNCIMDRGDFWAAQIAADIRAGKADP